MATAAGAAAGTRLGRMRQRGSAVWVRRLWVALLLAALALLVLWPIGLLVYASFVDSPPRPGAPPANFTLDNYAALAKPANFEAAKNSLLLAVFGTAGAVALGGGLAWLAARTNVPGRWLVQVTGIMPLFLAPLIGALAWSFLAAPRSGYLNLILRELGIPIELNVMSLGGMIFVSAVYYAPYVFLPLNAALSLMNPEYEEAATVHGSGQSRVLRSVTFPLVKPALLGSSILTFALILENFTIPQILGSQVGINTLPSRIWALMTSSPLRPNEATAVGILLFALMAVLIYGQNRMLRGRSFVTVSGKGLKPKVMDLGRWRWPAFLLAVLIALVSVVLPLLALLEAALRSQQYIGSLGDLVDPDQLGFENMREVLTSNAVSTGLRNSIMLGVLTAVFGGALHLAMAYVRQRTQLPGRRLIEYLVVIPVAVPALVLGLGFLWGWINLPVPVYGTIVVLVMAYSVRFMPQGYRSLSDTLGQVDLDLEDSAYVAGASRLRAVRTITLPLIRVGVVSATLLLFILAVRELTASLFLVTFETRVLAIVLYESWANGAIADVAAISLAYSALLLVITLVARRYFNVKQA